MRKLIRWVALYPNGQVFTSDTTAWEDLPQFGMQWLQKQYDNGDVVNFNGQDYFWHLDGVFANTNDPNGLLRRLPFVKFGEFLSDAEFDTIAAKANEIAEAWRNEHKPSSSG